MFTSPKGRRQVAIAKSVPAPVGGLNARDSLASMPVTDAVEMINFHPLPYAVAVRRGWVQNGFTNDGTPVQTVATHSMDDSPYGQHALICTSTSTYVSLTYNQLAFLTSDFGGYCQTTMLSTEGGDFTYLVNGSQNPRVYQATPDGSIGTFTTVSESLVNPPVVGFDVYGVDPSKFATVTWHQDRLWFAEQNTSKAWYLPPGQVGGEAKQYNFGAFFTQGGYIQAIISWSVDAGAGLDDHLCIVSSMGEILVYTGSNPSSSDTFTKKGLFLIGAPVGRRCWCKYGGDVLLITRDGLMMMSKALQSTRVNTSLAITDKIQQTISELVSFNFDQPGWQLLLFPNENQFWVACPAIATASGVRLFSMNTITGAWCEFRNIDPTCMVLYRDNPLFGRQDGGLGIAWLGYTDNTDFATGVGDPIEAEVLTAYNYFEDTAHNKRWTMARPIFQAGDAPSAAISLSVDFGATEGRELPLPPTYSTTPTWDVAIWDEDRWPGTPRRFRAWVSVEGFGYCAALKIRVKQNTPLLWTATEFVYEPGAVV